MPSLLEDRISVDIHDYEIYTKGNVRSLRVTYNLPVQLGASKKIRRVLVICIAFSIQI